MNEWDVALDDEYGEPCTQRQVDYAEALVDEGKARIREEVIQVLAVGFSILDALELIDVEPYKSLRPLPPAHPGPMTQELADKLSSDKVTEHGAGGPT